MPADLIFCNVFVFKKSLKTHLFRHLLPAGSAQRAALPVLFLLTIYFGGFRPAGATRCTDQGEI